MAYKDVNGKEIKVGDYVEFVDRNYGINHFKGHMPKGSVEFYPGNGGLITVDGYTAFDYRFKKVEEPTMEEVPVVNPKPDGGPSGYYDFPFKEWTTVNDMVEYLSEKSWGRHSWIFKDILKAVTRWGSKEGTTQAYDAKKIIYYGARLLMSVTDKDTLRKYLQQLLEDKQFQ